MKLYFIALVPEKKLKKKIQLIKEDFSEKFNSRHALKLPPHITLVPPFKIPVEKGEFLITRLEDVCSKEIPFRVELSGYGSFNPQVIFIDVKNKTPVIDLFFRLNDALNELYPEISEKREIYPHLTIASRDLNREAFNKAWPKYRNRAFEAKFKVKNLVLFRHTGQHWEKVQDSFCFTLNKKNFKD